MVEIAASSNRPQRISSPSRLGLTGPSDPRRPETVRLASSGSPPMLAALAILLTACVSGSPVGPTPSSSAAPQLATLSPSLPPDVLDLGALGWLSVVPELDPQSQQLIGHRLAIGTLNSAHPTWFQPLRESRWQFTLAADQQPVVDGPRSGKVLYVSDDGAHSEIRAISVHGGPVTVIGTTPDVVFAARLAPDAASAYVELLDRATGADRGVSRIELDGNGSMRQMMDPPTADAAHTSGPIRLAATHRFVRMLAISADGTELARLACGEPFGECAIDVQNLRDGTTVHYDNLGPLSDLMAIGGGYVLGQGSCSAGSTCVTDAISLGQRVPVELPGDWPAVDSNGRLVLLSFGPPTADVHDFWAASLDGDGLHRVFKTDGDVRALGLGLSGFPSGQVELPAGWVAVVVRGHTKRGTYQETPVAVRLADGGWVPLALPTLRPIGGGHD